MIGIHNESTIITRLRSWFTDVHMLPLQQWMIWRSLPSNMEALSLPQNWMTNVLLKGFKSPEVWGIWRVPPMVSVRISSCFLRFWEAKVS